MYTASASGWTLASSIRSIDYLELSDTGLQRLGTLVRNEEGLTYPDASTGGQEHMGMKHDDHIRSQHSFRLSLGR